MLAVQMPTPPPPLPPSTKPQTPLSPRSLRDSTMFSSNLRLTSCRCSCLKTHLPVRDASVNDCCRTQATWLPLAFPPPAAVYAITPLPFQLRTARFSSLHLRPALPLHLWAEMDASGSDVCIRSEKKRPCLPLCSPSWSPLLSIHPSFPASSSPPSRSV